MDAIKEEVSRQVLLYNVINGRSGLTVYYTPRYLLKQSPVQDILKNLLLSSDKNAQKTLFRLDASPLWYLAITLKWSTRETKRTRKSLVQGILTQPHKTPIGSNSPAFWLRFRNDCWTSHLSLYLPWLCRLTASTQNAPKAWLSTKPQRKAEKIKSQDMADFSGSINLSECNTSFAT